MSLYATYIIAHVTDALDQTLLTQESIPKDVGEPPVFQESTPIFSDDIMRHLQFFKSMAVEIEDFESWMLFLDKVASELKLNPASDFPKIASVLNRYRVDEGKEPL